MRRKGSSRAMIGVGGWARGGLLLVVVITSAPIASALRLLPLIPNPTTLVGRQVLLKGVVTAGVVGGVATVVLGVPAAAWAASNLDAHQDHHKELSRLGVVPPDALYTPAPGSLRGQTLLITGGTSGLGLEAACRLAIGGPAHLVVTARNDVKGQRAVAHIASYLRDHPRDPTATRTGDEAPPPNISYRVLDLDDVAQVKAAVAAWTTRPSNSPNHLPPLDVLLNNAGVMAIPQRQLTANDGYEQQFQSNHLGHFVLTAALAQAHHFTPTARIITVSSSAHQIPGTPTRLGGTGGLDLDYAWTGRPNYGAWKSYGQSKLANILFTRELQRRIDAVPGLQWTALTLHPGAVNTDLGRYLIGEERYAQSKQAAAAASSSPSWTEQVTKVLLGTFLKTTAQGATTQIYLAAEPSLTATPAARACVKARYFVDGVPHHLAAYATDESMARRLWVESELRGQNFV